MKTGQCCNTLPYALPVEHFHATPVKCGPITADKRSCIQKWRQRVQPGELVSKLSARCSQHPSWCTWWSPFAKMWLFVILKNFVSRKACLVCPQNYELEGSLLNPTLQFTSRELQQLRKFSQPHRLHLLRVIRMEMYGIMSHTHVTRKTTAACGW
jgi:hypothetical protein